VRCVSRVRACVRACVELVRVCLGRLAAERMAEAVGDSGVDLHETGRVVRWSEWAHHDVLRRYADRASEVRRGVTRTCA
jgi:hypothetical protein